MIQQNYRFWTCPACVHVRELNREKMSNRCQLIDQGGAPIDGKRWEYEDGDLCPAFESNTKHQAIVAVQSCD